MTTNQTLFFDCPGCDERFAQIEELDSDIHTGETYHCSACGVQVILRALSMEQHSELVNGRADCCCLAAQCEYEPSTMVDYPRGESR